MILYIVKDETFETNWSGNPFEIKFTLWQPLVNND